MPMLPLPNTMPTQSKPMPQDAAEGTAELGANAAASQVSPTLDGTANVALQKNLHKMQQQMQQAILFQQQQLALMMQQHEQRQQVQKDSAHKKSQKTLHLAPAKSSRSVTSGKRQSSQLSTGPDSSSAGASAASLPSSEPSPSAKNVIIEESASSMLRRPI